MSIDRRELIRDVAIGAAAFVAGRNLVIDVLASEQPPLSCIDSAKQQGQFGVIIPKHLDPVAPLIDTRIRSLQEGEYIYDKEQEILDIKADIERRHGISIKSPKKWDDGNGNMLENMPWELPEWRLLQTASRTLPPNYEFPDNFELWLAKIKDTDAPGGGGATYPDIRIELYISEQFAPDMQFIEGSIERDLFPSEGEQLKSAFHHEATHQQMFMPRGSTCYAKRFFPRFWKRDPSDPRDVSFQLRNPKHGIPFANADKSPWEHFAVAMSLIPYQFHNASILHPDVVDFFRVDPFFAEWFEQMSPHSFLPRVVDRHK